MTDTTIPDPSRMSHRERFVYLESFAAHLDDGGEVVLPEGSPWPGWEWEAVEGHAPFHVGCDGGQVLFADPYAPEGYEMSACPSKQECPPHRFSYHEGYSDALRALSHVFDCSLETLYELAKNAGSPDEVALTRSFAKELSDRFGRHGGAMRYWLYRIYGEGDRVLYVGITRNKDGRENAHRRRWGDAIHHFEWQEFGTHREALAAEKVLIQTLAPPFNAAGVS